MFHFVTVIGLILHLTRPQKLTQSEQRAEQRLLETEFRLITRLGFLVISTTSVAVAILPWLIKT
ncbi:MAG: hypothetical protein AB7G93_02395 [Bdellovibrionales bacterium]